MTSQSSNTTTRKPQEGNAKARKKTVSKPIENHAPAATSCAFKKCTPTVEREVHDLHTPPLRKGETGTFKVLDNLEKETSTVCSHFSQKCRSRPKMCPRCQNHLHKLALPPPDDSFKCGNETSGHPPPIISSTTCDATFSNDQLSQLKVPMFLRQASETCSLHLHLAAGSRQPRAPDFVTKSHPDCITSTNKTTLKQDHP